MISTLSKLFPNATLPPGNATLPPDAHALFALRYMAHAIGSHYQFRHLC